MSSAAMTVVWITQCLCPQRHCIVMSAGEAESRDVAEVKVAAPLHDQVAEPLATRELNPWCGLCGARAGTWTYELARTRWRTMAEAMPELKQLEAEQAVARAVLGDRPEGPNGYVLPVVFTLGVALCCLFGGGARRGNGL